MGSYTELTGSGEEATTFVERSYSLPAAAQVSTLYLKIVWNTSNTGAVIDEVQLTGSSAGSPATFGVTLNASGYATYCSEYPLDFSDYATADYSAWYITGISGSTITFSQITGSVKGGTGMLLWGTPGETITLTSANSTNELGDNLLMGTLAPTYVGAGEAYGLSGNQFVPSSVVGTIPAGKAYLDAEAVTGGSEVKAFTFVFKDADGIKEFAKSQEPRAEDKIFNLAGQRIDNSQFTITQGDLYCEW